MIVRRTRDLVSRSALRQGGVKGGPLLCPNRGFSPVRSETGRLPTVPGNSGLRRLPTSQVLGLLKGLYPQTFCTHPTLHANCSQILLAPRLTWPLYPCKTGTQEGRAATCLSAHSYTLLRIRVRSGTRTRMGVRAALDTQESILQPPWAGMRLSYKSRAGPCRAHFLCQERKVCSPVNQPHWVEEARGPRY